MGALAIPRSGAAQRPGSCVGSRTRGFVQKLRSQRARGTAAAVGYEPLSDTVGDFKLAHRDWVRTQEPARAAGAWVRRSCKGWIWES